MRNPTNKTAVIDREDRAERKASTGGDEEMGWSRKTRRDVGVSDAVVVVVMAERRNLGKTREG